MTPALIGLVGTVVIAFCLWVVEHALTKSKTPEALPQSNDEPLACDALIARTFEQRMVDAGIMTVEEMTVCENYLCVDCKPSRKPRQAVYAKRHSCAVTNCPETGVMEWNEHEHLCKAHYAVRQRTTAKGIGYKRGGEVVRIMGQDVPWPNNVPRHAELTYTTNAGNGQWPKADVVWTWYANGKTNVVRYVVMISPEFRGEDYSVYSDQSEKPVTTFNQLPPDRRTAARKSLARPMAKTQREKAIEQLRKNPPKPPKGKGAGSPKRINPGYS